MYDSITIVETNHSNFLKPNINIHSEKEGKCYEQNCNNCPIFERGGGKQGI